MNFDINVSAYHFNCLSCGNNQDAYEDGTCNKCGNYPLTKSMDLHFVQNRIIDISHYAKDDPLIVETTCKGIALRSIMKWALDT